MDLDDILRMEDDSAQRWEDSMKKHHCPKCDAIMDMLQSKKYGIYCRCPKCLKNFKPVSLQT